MTSNPWTYFLSVSPKREKYYILAEPAEEDEPGVGQLLLAVIRSPAKSDRDSQEWLSYNSPHNSRKIRMRACVFDKLAQAFHDGRPRE